MWMSVDASHYHPQSFYILKIINIVMTRMAFAVTVAGSDSSGGAGIQVDLKTMSACGVWGMTVIAALTAQNGHKVSAVEGVSPSFIEEQVRVLEEEFKIGCYKTGMLMNAETVNAAARAIPKSTPLVIDPVMVSTSRARLLDEEGEDAIISCLLPRADIATPNMLEAEYLSGIEITSAASMEKAAEWFLDAGAKSVVVKGGHASFRRGVDLYMDVAGTSLVEDEVLPFSDIHGSGCCYASAIASYIAKGLSVKDAVFEAKRFVTGAIKYSVEYSPGRRTMNPMWKMYQTYDYVI